MSYLGNTEKPWLPYCLRCMVTQVLIILGCKDGRELLQGVFESSLRRTSGFSWVVDGPVIRPFPAPCLAGVIVFLPSASNPTTGSSTVLGFLGRKTLLLRQLPFYGRFRWTRHHRDLASNLFLLRCILHDDDSSLGNLHLCTRVDGMVRKLAKK